MLEGWYRRLETWEDIGKPGEENAVGRHEGELDEGQRRGLVEGGQDGLRGRVRKGGRGVPEDTERLRCKPLAPSKQKRREQSSVSKQDLQST